MSRSPGTPGTGDGPPAAAEGTGPLGSPEEPQAPGASAQTGETGPAPSPGGGAEPGSAPAAEYERLTAYSYLVVPDRDVYIAIMRVFTGTFMADMSAHEVAEKLSRDSGTRRSADTDTHTVTAEQTAGSAAPSSPSAAGDLPVDSIARKLDQLKDWGALLPSARPVRAATVTEYQRSRGRYQLSPVGEIVQRHSEELLSADSIREVSRELLGAVAEALDSLAREAHEPGGVAGADALRRVSAIFTQFGRFVESVRDFYAYLGQVLNRFDLGDAEFRVFKDVLLDYAETITEDVARQTPVISAAVDSLWPLLTDLLERIDAAEPGLSALSAADVRVRRSSGRSLDDWRELRDWFADSAGRGSDVGQLRLATMKALQSLLGNAKRMLRSSARGELSRRNDLLKLARWVDTADDETAHDLIASAFAMYGARHLGGARGDTDQATSATSWWKDDPVEVAVSLRERGDRKARGAYRREGEDYSQAREDLLHEAHEHEARREAGAAELAAAAGREEEVVFSAAAFELFNELLGRAMAQSRAADSGTGRFGTDDPGLGVALDLREHPGRVAMIRSRNGDLALEGFTAHLGSSNTGFTQAREETGT
ncbi:DUF2397 family protein [Streptomonospora litoralis]|uniref:TIGR02677 family protein n=1 Tax=Streptomonospora litoralis TaxID=2498135 RepID=A0A4P6Q9E9_9ACTN|nr:DUF2397 family protein [Streptomonospora litoralis]QBI56231.1 hypothetical protein EKD16_22390 [Streptomonospora litoralis]